MWVALADIGDTKYEEARKKLRVMLAMKPEADIGARAQFLIVYSHLVTQEYAQACDAFEVLAQRCTGTTWA